MKAAAKAAGRGPRSTTWIAFLVGLPLACLIFSILHPVFGVMNEVGVSRYLKHSVECVEVILYCCAISALGAKFWHSRAERAACSADVLPAWDGKVVPVSEAAGLLAALEKQPPRLRNTYLGRRLTAVLEFLCQRRSAAELDDHLRALTDADALALEGSYALTRFITWAIPILGFLGTVLGITEAISGVTPEKLQDSLGSVTDGLALAFDATALGLALTMVTMFCSFLVERREQAVLDAVDQRVERQLAHRFQRTAADAAPILDAVRHNSQILLDAVGQVVERQAGVWAKALAEVQRQATETHTAHHERLTAALAGALDRTLEAHGQRAAGLEKQSVEQSTRLFEQLGLVATAVRDTGREQQAALAKVAEGVVAQAAALGHLQEGEKALIGLQTVLHQNLAALAGAGAFDQALHSLTAAVHLLSARAGAAEQTAALKYTPLGSGKTPSGKAA